MVRTKFRSARCGLVQFVAQGMTGPHADFGLLASRELPALVVPAPAGTDAGTPHSMLMSAITSPAFGRAAAEIDLREAQFDGFGSGELLHGLHATDNRAAPV